MRTHAFNDCRSGARFVERVQHRRHGGVHSDDAGRVTKTVSRREQHHGPVDELANQQAWNEFEARFALQNQVDQSGWLTNLNER